MFLGNGLIIEIKNSYPLLTVERKFISRKGEKMDKKTVSKIILGAIAGVLLFGAVAPSVAQASQLTSVNSSQVEVAKPTYEEVLASNVNVKDIVLINGIAFDKAGNAVVEQYGESQLRGKFSWAVKAIRAVIPRLPGFAKRALIKSQLSKFFDELDNFNGRLEDGIYQALRKAGLSPWLARLVAQAILLAI